MKIYKMLLFLMIIVSACSAQKANNPVLGVWQNNENPNSYGIFTTELNYLEVDYNPKNEKVSILNYKYGFTENCSQKGIKDLKSHGSMLVLADGSDDENNICYGYTFPEANQLFLEVWASNQNVSYKRIKALPRSIQNQLDKKNLK